jgi:hypothetical protein
MSEETISVMHSVQETSSSSLPLVVGVDLGGTQIYYNA